MEAKTNEDQQWASFAVQTFLALCTPEALQKLGNAELYTLHDLALQLPESEGAEMVLLRLAAEGDRRIALRQANGKGA